MSIALLSWLLPQWQHLQLAITLPVVLLLVPLLVPGVLPESTRWLMSKGFEKEVQRRDTRRMSDICPPLFIPAIFVTYGRHIRHRMTSHMFASLYGEHMTYNLG